MQQQSRGRADPKGSLKVCRRQERKAGGSYYVHKGRACGPRTAKLSNSLIQVIQVSWAFSQVGSISTCKIIKIKVRSFQVRGGVKEQEKVNHRQ